MGCAGSLRLGVSGALPAASPPDVRKASGFPAGFDYYGLGLRPRLGVARLN